MRLAMLFTGLLALAACGAPGAPEPYAPDRTSPEARDGISVTGSANFGVTTQL
ncbi:hypothetical protein SAMN04490244_102144 [Tranquillimonas rosea]|uniref:Argininosuccinate lyase n=1 Tax=Tranquillimonas rosea TaxID=641238 RepID=A0A1H9R662_9RHOB|nr:hypothetical protein [Tranquillimonas rosea]SER68188.1 hypothetical protein SAMN04490244_102144 [Tranquillimonas rosea]